MASTVANLKLLLEKNGFLYREEADSLYIKLPNDFGELQVLDLEDNGDFIGLVGSDWHTHSDCLGEPGTPKEERILGFLTEVLSGEYLLIEGTEPGSESRKTIENNLESYLKWLPKGAEYKIFN